MTIMFEDIVFENAEILDITKNSDDTYVLTVRGDKYYDQNNNCLGYVGFQIPRAVKDGEVWVALPTPYL